MKVNRFNKGVWIMVLAGIGCLLWSCVNDSNGSGIPQMYEGYLNDMLYEALTYRGVFEVKYLIEEKGLDKNLIKTGKQEINPLLYAIKKQNLAAVNYFLSINADLSYVDENGNNAILYAVAGNLYEVVRVLIDRGMDVNSTNHNNRNTLDTAIDRAADSRIFDLLFANGVKVKKSALQRSIDRGLQPDLIKRIYDKITESGMDLVAPQIYLDTLRNNTDMIVADLQNGDYTNKKTGEKAVDVIRLLIGLDCQDTFDELLKNKIPGLLDMSEYQMLINYACEYGTVTLLDKLVQYNRSLDFSGFFISPVKTAIEKKQEHIIRYLVSNAKIREEIIKGITQKTNSSYNVDQAAARELDYGTFAFLLDNKVIFKDEIERFAGYPVFFNKDHKLIIKRMIQEGFDINTIRNGIDSLLLNAGYSYVELEDFQWLIENGARTDIFDSRSSPLNLLAKYGTNEKMAYFLKTGGKVCDRAVLFAAQYGNFEGLKLLETYGADLSVKDQENNFNALHYAVLNANEKIVEYLIRKGVDKNAVNNDGNTPLLLAVERQRIDAVRILLDSNADYTVKNRMGATAPGIAKRNKFKLISELFKGKGIIK